MPSDETPKILPKTKVLKRPDVQISKLYRIGPGSECPRVNPV